MIASISTPYGPLESIYWLVKYFTGPSKRNAGIVASIPNSYILNKNVAVRSNLFFVGDIMPLGRRLLNIDDSLKEFISGSDCLIGNFEGILTQQRRRALFSPSDQRHSKEIIELLANFFPPERTYLCVANNHAGDFGRNEFFASVEMLKSRNFNVFGWNKQPYIDINDTLRIISGTMWSNRKCDYVHMLEGAAHHVKKGAFNILYPHFGYEHELYPRPRIIRKAKQLLLEFDAIIGHHPHCPQAVSVEPSQKGNKLLAYSLGNFSGAFKAKHYQYGIALKMGVGQNEDGQWLAGAVAWRFTQCRPLPGGDYIVSLRDQGLPFR
jgi:hypothetical protein